MGCRGPWWQTQEQLNHRSEMPQPVSPEKAVSLLTVLRNAMGKDLLTLPLPVELHEPQTDLQKMCENCEYSELLDKVRRQRRPAEFCHFARSRIPCECCKHLLHFPPNVQSF